jgi:hypothetical protein
MVVYDDERALRERSQASTLPLGTPATPAAPVTPATQATPATQVTPALSPMDLKMATLTDRFSRLTLLLEASLVGKPTSAANAPRAFPGAMPRPFEERFSNCIWCDATDHMRRPALPSLYGRPS